MIRPTYSVRAEHDACGIGFVANADGQANRHIVAAAIEALRRVAHRGALAADALTGDGAGVLTPIPRPLFGDSGVAMLFLDGSAQAREIVEGSALSEGLTNIVWRDVPVDFSALGDVARSSMPSIVQLLFDAPDRDELRCFRARKHAEAASGAAGVRLYAASWSFRTVTYKALSAAPQLANFYLDLGSERFTAPFAIFHQRYSTNTTPSWERAQPFRYLCHNGEINAIQGNVNQMRTREGRLGMDLAAPEVLAPLIDESGSDSAMLDNAIELLVRGGRDIRHAMGMLIPEFWQNRSDVPADLKAFYRYHSCLLEPWDGPAGVIFTDGLRVGATLDRNGLRPLRTHITDDGLVVVSSEVGTVDVDGRGRVRRGKLGPGTSIVVDPTLPAPIQPNAEVKRLLAGLGPWRKWVNEGLELREPGQAHVQVPGDLVAKQAAFGYTREDMTAIVMPMAEFAKEQTSSMGDDTAAPLLANRPRPLFNFFKHRFAQVTNPPIDHLRERLVMSLRTLVGPRQPLLTETAAAASLWVYTSFFLFPSALAALREESKWPVVEVDATFTRAEGLKAAESRIERESASAVRAGAGLVIISDRNIGPDRAPIPTLMAVSGVHDNLVSEGLRTLTSIVLDVDEPRETHHFACLLGYGADLICPRLFLASVAESASKGRFGLASEAALENLRKAVEDGVLKIMSKMGISTLDSYRGAHTFEAYGLGPEVIAEAFPDTEPTVWGIGFAEIEEDIWSRHAGGYATDKPRLTSPGFIKFSPRDGEYHANNPQVWAALHAVVGAGTDKTAADDLRAAHALQSAVKGGGDEAYKRFANLVNSRPATAPRDLIEFAPTEAIPLDAVEPAADIVRRFSTGAISHGSISKEAHETLAAAMNMIGGASNTGEGGEDPARFRDPRLNSKIKQIASGRFGVTPEYCAHASELQIKMAQGSKPGEGGQIPGFKVTGEIARLRHTQTGVTLISPPPHHDIYSIEDLAQLIFDLKQVNPRADVSVKLVSTVGVGTIAAGVAKAMAEVVHISGADGGTGASPLSSIKNCGLPWEIGLAETQHTLVNEGLRGRIRVRVDGGLKTGRDVVLAALLGADEFSFGTAVLLAEGCIMVRTCHRNKCPVGIATQDPELRSRYQGTPEMVAAYMMFVANEARSLLASMGLRSMDEAVGRTDLLRVKPAQGRASMMRLEALLTDARPTPTSPQHFEGPIRLQRVRSALGERLRREAIDAIRVGEHIDLEYAIGNGDRSVGAELGGEIGYHFGTDSPPGAARVTLRGAAGQSLGAFLAEGVQLTLIGEANDYVGKGMGGGRIIIKAPDNDAGDPVLAGNTVLYGATGGELFIAGRVGERFAVRNSGAFAVIEGAGMHACEYMTGGWVVILGPVGHNMAAGMSGGIAFVYDPAGQIDGYVNTDLVTLRRPDRDQLETMHDLTRRHVQYTDSHVAQKVLADWATASQHFWAVVPRTDVATIEARQDGVTSTMEGAPAA